MKYFTFIIIILIIQSCDLFFPDDYEIRGPKIIYEKTSDFNIPQEMNSEIWIMDFDGSNNTRLTEKNGFCWRARFHPNGREIYYLDYRNPLPGLYKMRIDGEFKTRIIDDQSLIVGYSFSPDGAQIVFEGVFNDNYDIYIMNSNGTNRQRLTDWFEWDVNPVFTPDGMQIVYVSQIDSFVSFEELTNFDLFIMNIDGFEKQNLTNQLASCGKPIMSPDGKTIAFRMTVVNGIHNIYAINIDGSNIRQFTYDGGSHPLQFSPDGSNILFKSNRNVDDRIFIMDSNGDNQTQITSEGTRNYSAQYSSDGEKIVFTAHEQDGNSIWVMDSDGSNRNRVFIYDYLGSVPQFQPIH